MFRWTRRGFLFVLAGLVGVSLASTAGCGTTAPPSGGGEGEPECAAAGEACNTEADCCEDLICGDGDVCAEAPVDPCEGVECDEGFECDPETGECVETVVDLCEGVECEDGLECNPDTGECEGGAGAPQHQTLFTDNLDDPNYQGTQTCLTCHANHAADIMESAHWNWSGAVDNIEGLEDQTHGKVDLINDY